MKMDSNQREVEKRTSVSTVSNSVSNTPVAETKKLTASKLEKITLQEFNEHVKEIRAQLADQLKCIGDRTDTQVAVLSEWEDFFRRRGESEAEHARSLEKLSRSIMQKHKTEKNRREAWSQHAACNAWQLMVDDTKEAAHQANLLAELYSKVITASISSRCDDLNKISKKCREIGALSHNELNRVLNELHTAMKTYQLCYSESAGVERKLRQAEDDLKRYEDANVGKNEGSRKHRGLSKHLSKRLAKFEQVRSKSTKSRNEYLMCVGAANAALHRFFAQDLSYLIDCMDLGMDFWIKSIIELVVDTRKKIAHREMDSLAELETMRSAIDSKADKQRFFEAHHAVFMLPKQFEFRPQLGDVISEVSAEKGLALELTQRQLQIEKRLEGLRFESDEVWKTLEASERQLLELYTSKTEDMTKGRAAMLTTYQFYLSKFEYFLLNGNLIDRLEARSRTITDALAKEAGHLTKDTPVVAMEDRIRRRTKRIGGTADATKPRPRLFGGSLDEYVELSGEPIPLLVVSAVAYLSRFSLRNQGLFRVSGSQSEINRFKEAYERGEDAFAELADGSESNSVAGVLKLYLRELREPLFPIFLFDQFTDCAKAESTQEFVRRTRELIGKLPLSHVLLLRFLFAFLSHLCEFADENMMEPHNMAICFGPTLIPIPEGKDQVFYHNYVNELVRNLIVHATEVFPQELPGPVYDKYVIADENDQMGYMDEGEGMSEDEEGLRDGAMGASEAVAGAMTDSTYEMTTSADLTRDVTVSTLRKGEHDDYDYAEDPSPASISSRSSNRSNIDSALLRRMSEDTSPAFRCDMSHRIANELNAKFASKERITSPYNRAPAPIWEHERPSSNSSSGASFTSNRSYHNSPIGIPELTALSGPLSSATYQAPPHVSSGRLPVMTSLRDQLHHLRRELNGRDDSTKIYPMNENIGLSAKNNRLSLQDKILDARGQGGETKDTETRAALADYTSRLAATSGASDMQEELKRALHEDGNKSVDPDIVASARTSARAQSEMVRTTAPRSPQLDEIAAALHEAALLD